MKNRVSVWFGSVIRRLGRVLLIAIGLLCLGLGIVGYIVPGLPGTIWLIIAATLFVRSSDRLYEFVIRNRIFGPQVRDFLETGSMGSRAKGMSITSMWVFSLISVIFAPYSWIFDGPILFLAIVGTVYIISRPTKSKSGNS